MPTLHPITAGIRNGRHQEYPTPGLSPYDAPTETAAEDTACAVLMSYHSVSFLRLVDDAGGALRTYRRGDFFQAASPLRAVHHRIVERRLAAVREESVMAAEMADAGK